jgi:hypothetical protein
MYRLVNVSVNPGGRFGAPKALGQIWVRFDRLERLQKAAERGASRPASAATVDPHRRRPQHLDF